MKNVITTFATINQHVNAVWCMITPAFNKPTGQYNYDRVSGRVFKLARVRPVG